MSSLGKKKVVLFYLQLKAMWQGSAGGGKKVYYCFIKVIKNVRTCFINKETIFSL